MATSTRMTDASTGARIQPYDRHLWVQWFGWVTAGEAAGFLTPALVGALTVDASPAISVPLLLAAGAIEGALLGAAQVHVLRRRLPAISARRWIVATSAAAVFAYVIGQLPSTLGDAIGRAPLALVIPVGAVLGLALLLSIGTAQWIVLRHHVPGAARWIAWTAAAWLAGLAVFLVVATPLWQEGQPVWLTIAIGAFGGLLMAASAAAVTGHGLVRLLRGVVSVRPNAGAHQ